MASHAGEAVDTGTLPALLGLSSLHPRLRQVKTVPCCSVDPVAGKGRGTEDTLSAEGTCLGTVTLKLYEDPARWAGKGPLPLFYKQGN